MLISKDISDNYFAEYKFKNQNIELYINITCASFDDKYISNKKGHVYNLSDRIINIYWDDMYDSYVGEIYIEEYFVCVYGIKDENEIYNICQNIK